MSRGPVQVTAVRWIGGIAVDVEYRDAEGTTGTRLLRRSHEAGLALAHQASGPFRSDAEHWRVAAEALRIRRCELFEPMPAVATSALEPLPHQLLAVYDELLPRSPLRFLLADDPGAGKTITAGLYLKELILRADVARCLIVVPGSLVDQWQQELHERFGLAFERLSADLAAAPGSDVFERHPFLLARMDHLSRNDDLLARLRAASEWDLVIVDEAHRMSAHYSGHELRTTRRYDLGALLAERARHLLLMTATPHAGRHEDFHAFLALLDRDRFEGRFTVGANGVADTTGIMRRLLKEDLRTLDGRPLFPERRAYTVPYHLSPAERMLYEAVTDYVRNEMGRADRLREHGDLRRGNTVGFALTILQRRLASSPEAILRSLERRRDRLRRQLAGDGAIAADVDRALARLLGTGPGTTATAGAGLDTALDDLLLDPDDQPANGHRPATATGSRSGSGSASGSASRSESWGNPGLGFGDLVRLEEEVTDAATAARTRQELEAEIALLDGLVATARLVRSADSDRKWTELRTILHDDPRTRDETGRLRKIIIFTEHRDTQRYLVERITALLGDPAAVTFIHGGLPRERRLAAQHRFTHDQRARVLVATDAAGEGVNLQVAHLLVNYDLPWNPNRIEQRFGRIHRIGQREVCHMWNLVATDTREGDVFHRLLEKIEQQREAYSGRVFDVLGAAFTGRPLRDLLVEAIRYGDRPDVRGRLHLTIDAAVGAGLAELLERRALHADVLAAARVDDVRRRHAAAASQGLRPADTEAFFQAAFPALGGRIEARETGCHEIVHVPPALRDSPGARFPVLPRYRRVSFDPRRAGVMDASRPAEAARSAPELLDPTHPLVAAVTDATLRRGRELLRAGTVLLDPDDPGTTPRLLAIISEEIVDGHRPPRMVSRRTTTVELRPDGTAVDCGPAPYLRYLRSPTVDGALPGLDGDAGWLTPSTRDTAMRWAVEHLMPGHLAEVRGRVQAPAERTRRLVAERLTAEIAFWRSWRADEAGGPATGSGRDAGRAGGPAGRGHRLSAAGARRRAEELQYRLDRRLADLDADLHLMESAPVVEAVALVVPAGLAPPTTPPPTTPPPLTPPPTTPPLSTPPPFTPRPTGLPGPPPTGPPPPVTPRTPRRRRWF